VPQRAEPLALSAAPRSLDLFGTLADDGIVAVTQRDQRRRDRRRRRRPRPDLLLKAANGNGPRPAAASARGRFLTRTAGGRR
jgi:hypothetical protein